MKCSNGREYNHRSQMFRVPFSTQMSAGNRLVPPTTTSLYSVIFPSASWTTFCRQIRAKSKKLRKRFEPINRTQVRNLKVRLYTPNGPRTNNTSQSALCVGGAGCKGEIFARKCRNISTIGYPGSGGTKPPVGELEGRDTPSVATLRRWVFLGIKWRA